MSEWISVEDRLPEPFHHVALIAVNRYQNCPDIMDDRCHVKAIGYLHDFHPGWMIKGERGSELSAFTHWMELPPPPL